MALLVCPECKGSVSSLAKACPSCGVPLKDDLQEPFNPIIKDVSMVARLFKYFVYVVLAVMVLEGIINGVMSCR